MKKFLCPECRKFVDEFYEGFDEYSEWRVEPKQNETSDVEYVECVEQTTVEHVRTFCDCGFESETYTAEDFIVEVDDERKTVTPIGAYWKIYYDDFVDLVEELGYTPIGVENAEICRS